MRTFVSSRCVSVGRRRDWRRPGTCSRNASAPSRSPSSLAIQSVDATRSVGGGPRDWSLATNSPVFGARKRSAPWRRSSRTPTCRSKSSKRRAVTCCHGPESVRRGRSAGDPTGPGRCQRMPGTAAGQPRIRGCRSTSAAGGPVRRPGDRSGSPGHSGSVRATCPAPGASTAFRRAGRSRRETTTTPARCGPSPTSAAVGDLVRGSY